MHTKSRGIAITIALNKTDARRKNEKTGAPKRSKNSNGASRIHRDKAKRTKEHVRNFKHRPRRNE